MAEQPPAKTRLTPGQLLNLAALGLIWLDLFWMLHLEWRVNEQYSYGFLVPLIAGYLIYLRYLDAPEPGHARVDPFYIALTLAVAAVGLIPLHVVLESNPEWRFAFWLHGGIVSLITAFIVWGWGGTRWLVHFGPALAMLLFAIPWPMRFETGLTQELMRIVATVTTETLNLIGIFAIQRGNLIELESGLVGVEEACSGVRSFQSTLMAAYFLGELFRFPWVFRGAVIALGLFVAFLLNIARSLLLTFVAHQEGGDWMEHWHDPVGHVVALVAFGIVFVICWLGNRHLRKRERQRQLRSGERSTPPPMGPRYHPRWLPAWAVVAPLILLVASHAFSKYWYARRESPQDLRPLVVDWPEEIGTLEFRDIPPRARALLRYSEGVEAHWRPNRQQLWIIYFLTWEEGRISSFAGIHNPEICLPAVGYELIGEDSPVRMRVAEVDIEVQRYTFQALDRTVYVFYSVWDDHTDETVPMAMSAADRLWNAYQGYRVRGRRSVELILVGSMSMDEATAQVVNFLQERLVVGDGFAAM